MEFTNKNQILLEDCSPSNLKYAYVLGFFFFLPLSFTSLSLFYPHGLFLFMWAHTHDPLVDKGALYDRLNA